MFSDIRFIALSGQFVCVKLATFERREHQDMCEKLLGAVKNTSFTVFSPDGTETLVKPSRSPRQSFGGKYPHRQIEALAERFGSKGSDGKTVLQDFHSLKQALVASSADQRLLVVTVGQPSSLKFAEQQAARVFNDFTVRGVAHFDQVTAGEEEWEALVKGRKLKVGHFVLRVEPFGRHATVMEELPLSATTGELLSALIKANETFATVEKRKDYHAHLNTGIEQRIRADTNIGRGAVRAGKSRSGR